MVKIVKIENIPFYGGRLCLNYVNTIYDRLAEPWLDYFHSVHDIIYWAFRAELIGHSSMSSLKAMTIRDREKTKASYKEALEFRETLYKMFLSIARHKKIPERAMNDFNNYLARYYSHIKISQSNVGFKEDWNFPSDSLYQIQAPILKDAYDLLLFGKQERIRECPNCGWLFYDTSKNGQRRWCSMSTCGSNVKALNWYHKHKTRDA